MSKTIKTNIIMTINVTNITFTIMINVTTVTKGEEGETFFFIEEGQARVMMSRGDGEESQQVNMIFLIIIIVIIIIIFITYIISNENYYVKRR